MSAPRRAAALRPSILSFNQEDDLKTVLSLTGQYKAISKQNEEAIDELCRLADGLHLSRDSLNETMAGVRTSERVNGSESQNIEQLDVLECDLRNDIEELRKCIASKKAENRLNMKLLDLFVAATEKYVDALCRFYSQRSYQALEIHRKYAQIIESKQKSYIDLVNQHNELTNGFFQLVRSLGTAMNMAVDYKNENQSPDCQDARTYALKGIR